MRRILGSHVYGVAPRAGCWWDETCDLPECAVLDADLRCDVAIVGGGFTGLNAALELAARGVDVLVLDAEHPGWGASGRNGGFCCLGGSKLEDDAIDRRFGREARLEWRAAEVAAIDHVAEFLERSGTVADVHSEGEAWLAHRARDMHGTDRVVARVEEDYGVTPRVRTAEELRADGMSAGFHGGVTIPLGFALNPRKYLVGLTVAAQIAGVRVFSRASVDRLERAGTGWRLRSGRQVVRAEQVLVATNGYSSEDVPHWLAGRYMPAQSSVVVTRPLTRDELEARGWTSRQMCYDSRNLLHYFRLMPDDRMLFGMRGGLGASAVSEARARARVIRDFRAMFPAWADVPITNYWSGLVCLSRGFMPFAGPVPDSPGLWCAMCYHGNGVAMGSYAGKLVAQAMSGRDVRPVAMREPLDAFPLGRARRALMLPVYAGFALRDL
jgi:glycine/D-amino acid oxidase-like deaminating enzyme